MIYWHLVIVAVLCLGVGVLVLDFINRARREERIEARMRAASVDKAQLKDDEVALRVARYPLARFINEELTRAGAEARANLVLPYLIGALVLSLAAGFIVKIWCGFIVLGLSLVFPWAVIKWLQRKRLQAFIERLPVFLERVRQLVLIGNPVQYAFMKAIADAEPTCQVYLAGVAQRVRHGASFPETLLELSRRLRIQDVHMLSACIKANSRYGGRISNNLANLVTQLNNKRRLDREIRAATAETRTSVAILLALTGGLMVFVFGRNPESLSFFLNDSTGQLLLMMLIGLPATGLAIMQRILKIDL